MRATQQANDHLMDLYLASVAREQQLQNKLDLIVPFARDAAETMNRRYPCSGDRLIRICDEVEGIQPDQEENQEDYEA
ncbi:hypothetical protein D3C72_987680 [compost metagenome]